MDVGSATPMAYESCISHLSANPAATMFFATYLAAYHGVEYLTVYAFSTENWVRPKLEVSGLMRLLKTFLKKDAEIRFKTDDDELFEESIEYFEQSGYEIKFITRDLHAENIEDNIVTEHERMFTEEGKKIKYLVAVQQGN